MATGVLLPNGENQFWDLNGEPLNGGLVYMYVPGTTTPKTTWVDQAETTANTNPIVLDSLGRCIIWGSGTYRQVVTDALGNLIWDQLTSDAGQSALQGEIDTLNTEVATLNTEVAALQADINATPTWLKKTFLPSTTSYLSVVTDSATLISSFAAGGTMTVTLPNTTTLPRGWYAAFIRITNGLTVQVEGSHSEVIRIPGSVITSFSLASNDNEIVLLSYDGGNYEIITATPATWAALGVTPGGSIPNSPLVGGNGTALVAVAVGSGLSLLGGVLSSTGAGSPQMEAFGASGTFTIPATTVKVTAQGGGGGGGGLGPAQSGGAGGGGQGAFCVTVLSGLTIGSTLTVNIGAGGTGGPTNTGGSGDGAAGGNTTVSSGSQIITTITAGGGNPGGGLSAIGGAGGTGSGAFFVAIGNSGANGDLTTFGYGGPGSYGRFGAGGSGSANILADGQDGILGFVIFEWVG